MTNSKKQAIFSLFIAFMLVFSGNVLSQDKATAIKAFNKGLDLAKSNNYDDAIESFQKAHDIAKQIEDADLQERTAKQLPTMYYQKAVTTFNEFKSNQSSDILLTAIEEFGEAQRQGEKYGNDQIARKSQNIKLQLTYNLSTLYFKQERLDSAQAAVNRAINMNSNYAKAYYHKALVEKKMGNFDQFLALIDQAINKATINNDTDLIEKAEEKAAGELIYKGVNAIEDDKLSQAEELLNRALAYNENSANAHYRIAELANKRGNRQKALTHSQKALELETGGKTDKAKIYFELGLAQQGLGNKTAACDAFENAAYGSFKSNAEHKMEFELKCEKLAQSE